ncbi:MAG: hypothetical protein KC656_17975, partial [Myxococcales bacterium]|nr:hypothetical protein [Myxococcales bacterium]
AEPGAAGGAEVLGRWLVARATDDWVDPEAAASCGDLLVGAEVRPAGEALVWVRAGSVSAWTLELRD